MTRNKYYVLDEVVGKTVPIKGGKKVILRANMKDGEIQKAVREGVHISHFGETELGQKQGNGLATIAPNLTRVAKGIKRTKVEGLVFPTQKVQVVEKVVEKVVEGDSAKILDLATKIDSISRANSIFKKEAKDFTTNDVKALQKATGLKSSDKQELYDAIH